MRKPRGEIKMSTVSVAIATYGRAAMVRQAVVAALAQTCPPAEIIVSDDASPDQTLAVLEQLARSNPSVHILRQARNTGGVPNWNAALLEASGDFLALCSDDDRFLEDHLEASLAYLEAHPEVGLVHSGFVDAVETDTHNQRILRPHRFGAPHRVDRRNLLRYMMRYYDWPFHPSTIVMRRAVWEQTGPFDPAFALADTDWFVRASERFPVVLLPRHGVLNRRHPGNWSNRLGSAGMQREIFTIIEGAIARRWPGNYMARGWAKAFWRAHVRVRLLLTVRVRVRSGHADAACAAWHQLLEGTGRSAPTWMENAGQSVIRRLCARRETRFEDARQSVSPL
jgi:glycosyltransferase involved in cell wall biosynthesis